MTSVRYPLDAALTVRKRKQLKRELQSQPGLLDIRIALLGGATTSEVLGSLDVLLLSRGVRASFYESQYNRFYEDAVVDASALVEFRPDIVYVCTTSRNVQHFPALLDSQEQVDAAVQVELKRFGSVWESIERRLPGCTILQNNFDPAPGTGLGNLDAAAVFGRANFLSRLNAELAAAVRLDPKLFLVDLHGLAARVGMNQWFSPEYWYSYKMPFTPDAAVLVANSVSALIAALYGRSKKCLVLDLDNTLWGGVIGDDGVDNLKLGRETAQGEAYFAFQAYCKQLQERGVLLAVCSKNDAETARSGFRHPDSVLSLEDFASFQANWNPKPENIEAIARELNIGLDSLVFADDNPAERAMVSVQLPMVMVPELGEDVSRFAEILDGTGYFEAAWISAEDRQRSRSYAGNAERAGVEAAFKNYGDYLAYLQMETEIAPFCNTYLDRIAQLTNKTNQFNLTTRRYTRAELESLAARPDTIALYGRLRDRFGDNGLVSVALGRVDGATVHIDLWLMSCRVLKRRMELAMLDRIVEHAKAKGAARLAGYYIRSPKNNLVEGHYQSLGFECVSGGEARSEWSLEIGRYEPRNRYIKDISDGSAGNTVKATANLS
jgi:FkbH-like protein